MARPLVVGLQLRIGRRYGDHRDHGSSAFADPAKPNILLVIADDFGLDAAAFDPANPWYDVGDPSNDAAMPMVAGLCATGVRFNNAWAMTTCSPTRATMLTGTYPYQHGVLEPVRAAQVLDTAAWTLPKALAGSDAGYDLASFGKWHVSLGDDDPNIAGWPHYAGSLSGSLAAYDAWDKTVNGDVNPTSTYATTDIVNDALAWVGQRGEAPWLMWLAFNAPHTPFHEPPSALHTQGALGPYTTGDPTPWFHASLEALDTELARLRDALIAAGEWENTVIIFVGDNGTAGRAADDIYPGGRAKGALTQGGIAVPLVVTGPGIDGNGRSSDALVSVVDLFATILELAGLDPEAERQRQAPSVSLDSTSIVPLLEGNRNAVNATVLAERRTGEPAEDGKAIRTLAHKLICREDGTVELYDLGTDALEANDLYVDGTGAAVGYEDIYLALRDALRTQVNDPTLCP